MIGVQRDCADATQLYRLRYPFRVHGQDARRPMLAGARGRLFALIVLLLFARGTHHLATLTCASVRAQIYRGIHMDRFLSALGCLIAFVFILAVSAGLWALLVWVVKAVWQS
jgi:hypothetical protein